RVAADLRRARASFEPPQHRVRPRRSSAARATCAGDFCHTSHHRDRTGTTMAYPPFHESGPRDLPMAMLEEQSAALFSGESDYIEFKQGVPEAKIKEAVVAFSNSDGGVLLIGVTDSGRAVGTNSDGEA